MAKQQHLEILKLIHVDIGQCSHWETMNFHKEINALKNYDGGNKCHSNMNAELTLPFD